MKFFNSNLWTGRGENEHREADQRVHCDSEGSADAGGAAEPAGDTAGAPGHSPGAGENPRIVLGEITAYRCWDTSCGVFRSLNGAIWFPDEPMSGAGIGLDNSTGVYAFRTLAEARRNAKSYGHMKLAVGRVKMWGTVVEHEDGYRAEYAKIDEIIDGDITDRSQELRATIKRERGRLGEFESDHERDKAGYGFRCERYGDFLSVFIERLGQKTASALPLIRVKAITPEDGMGPSIKEVRFSLYENGGGKFYLYREQNGPAGAMLHVPVESDKNEHSHMVMWSSHERSLNIPDCADRGTDDRIVFQGTGVTIFAPAGCGEKVYRDILAATSAVHHPQ